jgi:Glycosyltransferase family 87
MAPTAPTVKDGRDFSLIFMAIACALAALFTILFLCTLPFSRAVVAKRDFITYWAAGHQLVHHADPYNAAALDVLERNAGFTGGTPYFMRNVPWGLPLALPLGYFSPQAAALPWSLLMLGLLIASVHMVSSMLDRPANNLGAQLAWIGYCFPPALDCVLLGQTSILLLFGLVLFLRLHRGHPFAAGAALWLCSLKPHLFLPFGVVLLVWLVVSRNYRIIAGAATAMAAGALLTTLIDPTAWRDYAHYMRTSVVTHEFTACLGDVIRDSINPGQEWLAFIPALLGCAWALAWFWPRRHVWDWLEDGSLLILVSLIVAPFGWIFDQTLAIPAILLAAARNTSRLLLASLAVIYLLVEFQVNRFDMHSKAYLWIAPAWLVWFVLARIKSRQPAAVPAEV